MLLAVVFTLILISLLALAVWAVWRTFDQARSERYERTRVARTLQQAEYQLHQRASQAFGSMLQVARDQSGKRAQQ